MQQQKVQNQSQSEDDVLNFDLDDISLEDIDQQDSGNEQEVIELIDLVARGMPVEATTPEQDTKEYEVVDLLKEDQLPEEDGEFKLLADDLVGLELGDDFSAEKETAEHDVADFALELDLSEEEKPKRVEEKVVEEPASQVDFEDILKEEEVLELVSEVADSEGKDLEEVVSLEDLDAAPEKTVPDQPELFSEDLLKDESSSLVHETAAEPSAGEISESKELEEIVSLEELDASPEKSAPDQPELFSEDFLKEEAPEPPAGGISESKDLEKSVSRENLDAAPEKSTPDQADLFSEDLLKDEAPSPAVPEAGAEPPAAGVSEEKLEAIVTRVVQEVLERVARETMASVAERVIGEAIESLKKSLSENP